MGGKLLRLRRWILRFLVVLPKTLTWLAPWSAPFFYLTVAFAVGVFLARSACSEWILWGSLSLVLVLGIVLKLLKDNWLALVVLGFCVLGFFRESSVERSNPLPMEVRTQFIAQVIDIPQVKGRYQRVEGRILCFRDGDSLYQVDAVCQLNIDTLKRVDIGDVISYESKTYFFDSIYTLYYENRGVFGRQFIYQFDSLGSDFSVQIYLQKFRDNIAQRIRTASSDTQATAIMSALTVGLRGDISYETRAAYRAAGASHLLAISGLHVGIILSIIGFFTYRLMTVRKGTLLHLIIVSTVMAAFCLLSGMAPSVLRAVLMFFILEVGWYFDSRNMPNTLMFSAFILLLFDPSLLFDISFGLSYMAMMGIALFCRPIMSFVKSRRKKLFAVWGVVSVSIAAQMFTLPLVLYIFGEISLAGVFTSLIVWITAPLIISLTILYLILPLAPIGWAVSGVASFQNWVMGVVGDSSWAVIRVEGFSGGDCVLYYSVLIVGGLLANSLFQVFSSRRYLMDKFDSILR